MRGIAHRNVQRCDRCRQPFMWTPQLGLCPYCDLSQRARQGSYEPAEPCPASCCTEGKAP
jgi:hypothetical protein